MKWSSLVAGILILTLLLGCSPKAPMPLPSTQEAPPPAAPPETPAPTTSLPLTLAVPILKLPINGKLTSSLTPTLEWQPSARGASYGLQVATDQGFSNIVIDERGLKEASYVVPSPKLDYGKTYYWRVGVGNAGGKSGWSPFWSFEVLSKPTPPPTPTFPPTTKTTPSPTVAGAYSGPLFDTHLHMVTIQKSWAAKGLPSYLQQRKVDWAIGFYKFTSDTSSGLLSRNPIVNGLNSYVIGLLQPGEPKDDGWSQFASGQFSEAVLRKFLQPQGPLQGVGEIILYTPGLQSVTFDSPVMQTVFQVVNESKGIVMVHPSSVPRGRPTELTEIEPPIRKYPDTIFLFHGQPDIFNLVVQLMPKYPNVYFTVDAIHFGMTDPNESGHNLLAGNDNVESFLADVNRIGSDRLVEDGINKWASLLQQYPDRIMWGTDLSASWHFEDSVTDTVIEISRKFIGKLPVDIQEKYAYQNAQRVFGRFLTPNP